MGKPAEQDDGEARLIIPAGELVAIVLALLRLGIDVIAIGAQAEAGGGGDGQDGNAGIEKADKPAQRRGGEPDNVAGTVEKPVADDAAKSGRQGPAGGDRQGAGDGGCRRRSGDPEGQAQGGPFETMGPDQAQPPDERRQKRGQNADSGKLHGQIGEDCPGPAQNILDLAGRGIVEARIIDRPGHERRNDAEHDQDQRKSDDLGGAPRCKFAQGIGQAIQKGA